MKQYLAAGFLGYANITDRMLWRRYTQIAAITNLNPARNFAIRLGIESGADYVIPLDMFCVFPTSSLTDLSLWFAKESSRSLMMPKAILFPYKRAHIQDSIIQDIRPVPRSAAGEVQVALHRATQLRFDEGFRYGVDDKFEFLLRLQSFASDQKGTIIHYAGGSPAYRLETTKPVGSINAYSPLLSDSSLVKVGTRRMPVWLVRSYLREQGLDRLLDSANLSWRA